MGMSNSALYMQTQQKQMASNQAHMSEWSTNDYMFGVPVSPNRMNEVAYSDSATGQSWTWGELYPYDPNAPTAYKNDQKAVAYYSEELPLMHTYNEAYIKNATALLPIQSATESAKGALYGAQANSEYASAGLATVNAEIGKVNLQYEQGVVQEKIKSTVNQYGLTEAQMKAQTGLTTAQTGLVQAQTGNTYADTTLTGAQTGLTGAQAGKVQTETGLTALQLQQAHDLYGVDTATKAAGMQLGLGEQQAKINLMNAQASAALRPQSFAPPSPKDVAEAKVIQGTAASTIAATNATNKMNQELIPANQAAQQKAYELAKAKSEMGIRLSPAEEAALASQYALTKQQSDLEMGINPARYGLEGEQIASARELLPGQTAASKAETANKLLSAEKRAPIISKFYEQALAGADPTLRANQAQADVEHAYGLMDKQMRDNAAVTGIDPSSPAYQRAVKEAQLTKAKGIAGARTAATTAVEDENYRRLTEAMGVGGVY